MRDPDPRAVLGLPLDATRGEAQRAFRQLAKQTHPDAGGNAADFRVVAGAWAELTSRLLPDRPPAPVSPHVRAYRAASQVLWTETRPPVQRDFQTILEAELARLAA
jgi:curved DNA-binding protein CbpA